MWVVGWKKHGNWYLWGNKTNNYWQSTVALHVYSDIKYQMIDQAKGIAMQTIGLSLGFFHYLGYNVRRDEWAKNELLHIKDLELS